MKKAIAYDTITVAITRTEVTKTEGKYGTSESRRSVPDGTKIGQITLLIDVEALLRTLGEKAMRSKGGRAREVGGLVEVVVERGSVIRRKA